MKKFIEVNDREVGTVLLNVNMIESVIPTDNGLTCAITFERMDCMELENSYLDIAEKLKGVGAL